jgi:hypothetical protein
MASNWNPIVAWQRLGESIPQKNVLPIKRNDDTHIRLHSSALVVIQQVADAVPIVREGSNSFKTTYLLRGPNFPPERPHLGVSCYRVQGGFNCNL